MITTTQGMSNPLSQSFIQARSQKGAMPPSKVTLGKFSNATREGKMVNFVSVYPLPQFGFSPSKHGSAFITGVHPKMQVSPVTRSRAVVTVYPLWDPTIGRYYRGHRSTIYCHRRRCRYRMRRPYGLGTVELEFDYANPTLLCFHPSNNWSKPVGTSRNEWWINEHWT